MKLHKILLVDGDVNILGVLKIRLGLMGYDVTAVKDANKAIIACLEREQFYLMLTETKQISAFQVEQERFQSPLEIVGAVAHELTQPVQSIVGWGEILQKSLDESDPSYETLKRISDQIETVSNLLSRLISIIRYVIKEYPGSTTIIDVEKASSPKKDPSSS